MTTSITHPENRPSHPAERRLHPRVELDCPVTVSLADGQHAARLRDLSRAGVCLFLDRRIPEMTILGLSLELPVVPSGPSGPAGSSARVRRVQGRGVVVRCQPLSPHVDHFEIAVFLNDLDERNRRALEDYVALRARS